jgi:hypothetical protein
MRGSGIRDQGSGGGNRESAIRSGRFGDLIPDPGFRTLIGAIDKKYALRLAIKGQMAIRLPGLLFECHVPSVWGALERGYWDVAEAFREMNRAA